MNVISPTHTLRTLTAAGIVFLALGAPALHAGTLFWDGTTTDGNANGGVGTWDNLTTFNWDTTAMGGANAQWNNANNDTAVFGGVAGAVTLGGNISVGGLTFSTTGYGITNGANTLSFNAANNAILQNNVAASTISGTVGGSGNVSLSSSNPATASTLTFNGASAGGWSGTTTVNAATTLAATSNTPAATQNLALKNTSGITLNGGAIVVNRLWAGPASENYINDSAPVTVNSGGTLNISSLTAGNNLLVETIHSVTVNSGQFFLSPGNGSSGSRVTVANGISLNGTSAIGFFSNTVVSGTNTITVTSAGTTGGWVNAASSNPIIGPWATVGTTAALQTDYAVYNANVVTAANTAGSVETTWTNAAHSYTNSLAAQTLTGTRTISALRNTGATSTLTLASGANLETYGVLNGVNTLLTVAPGTGGVLTTPAGGGNLHVNAGSGAITVNAPINNNGGAVTLVKNGSGTLTLGSTTGTYSGGTVLNAGTLATTADSNLGVGGGIIVNGAATWNAGINVLVTYNRSLTVNEGSVLSLASGNAGKTITGVLSGNGAIVNVSTTGFDFSNTGNTFTGTVNSGYTTSFASLGDSSNPINLVNSNSVFVWNGIAKTFALRPFTLNAASTATINNNGTGALTIQQPLAITGVAGARGLTLGGTYTASSNTFAGNIADGIDGGASVVSLNKTGTNSWALSGTNTYSGPTTYATSSNPNPGFLTFQGMQALSPFTSLNSNQISLNQAVGTFRLLDDSATPASRSGVNLNFSHPENAVDTRFFMRVFVGNNSIANGGTSASVQTGSTIEVGNFNITQPNATQTVGGGLDVTGANGYKLQVGNVNVNLQAAFAAAWPVRLNANTADVIVGGNVQQLAGATSANVTLQLDGAATGSKILGNVLNSADGTPRVLSVTKQGTGNWALDGTGNAFTGAITLNSTTTSAGTLSYASAAGTNPITFNQTTSFGTTLSYTGASPLTMSGLISASALTTGGIIIEANGTNPAATINYSNPASLSTTSTSTGTRFITLGGSNTGDNTFAGAINNNTGAGGNTQVAKTGAGKWVLTGNSNFSGGLFVNNGTISVNSIPNGGVNSPLGANTRIHLGRTNDDGILIYTGAGDSTNRDVRIGGPLAATGTGGGSILNDGAGALTFTAATFNISQASIAFNRTLTLGGSYTGGANEIQGVIQNNTASTGLVNLVKNGASAWRLAGTNTYTGTTTVNGGTLLVNGSTAAGSAVTVNSGGTLGGTGTVAGSVLVNVGGTLAPGNSIGAMNVGPTTIMGNYAVELGTPGVSHAAPGLSDLSNVTGNLNYAGATLNLIDNAGANAQGSVGAGSYRIFTYTGTNGGAFGSINAPGGLLPVVVDEGFNGSGGPADGVFLDLFNPAAASFTSPAPSAIINLNIGTFGQNSGIHAANFDVFNLALALGPTVGLDLDSFSLVSLNDPNLSTNLATFTNLAPGGNLSFMAFLNTLNVGTFSESYQLSLSSNGFADPTQSLTLNISGTVNAAVVVPEPSTLAMWSLLALAGLVGARRLRRK